MNFTAAAPEGSIIFGLLALEDLAPAVTHRVLPVLVCTVLLSVSPTDPPRGRSRDATEQ